MTKFQKKLRKKIRAQGTIEFLVIFVILFIFFIGITDIALFFRQIYLVQTLSDETLARLQTAHQCSELSEAASTMASVVKFYYGASPEFSASYSNGFYRFSSGRYSFILACRNATTPDALAFSYKYSGIFFFASQREIFSNFSANTSYF